MSEKCSKTDDRPNSQTSQGELIENIVIKFKRYLHVNTCKNLPCCDSLLVI